MNQRGFVFAEFVIALPLLILLLYTLGTLTLKTMKIAREQVADYTLETEAQEMIDRITADARNAYSVEIKPSVYSNEDLDTIIFMCDNITNEQRGATFDGEYIVYNKEVLEPRIYAVYTTQEVINGYTYPHLYFKRKNDDYYSNPIIGSNSYGNTVVEKMKYSINEDAKILHITLEFKNRVTEQRVKFSTAVFMPNYKSNAL